MQTKAFALLAVAALLAAGQSRAELVGYTLSGTVATAWGKPFNGISPHVGDPITGLFTYDPASGLTTIVSPQLASYGQLRPNRISLTLGGVTFETGPTFTVLVENNMGSVSAPYDLIDLYDYHPSFPGAVPDNSLIEIHLADLTGGVFSDLSLPHTLNLASFNSQANNLETVSDGVNSGVTFQITSLNPFVVPEPGPGILLLTGLGFGLARLRLRRAWFAFLPVAKAAKRLSH